MTRCHSCDHRRPDGTLADLERKVLEALPVHIECIFVHERTPGLEPGTVRVTIEEPVPHMPSSDRTPRLSERVVMNFNLCAWQCLDCKATKRPTPNLRIEWHLREAREFLARHRACRVPTRRRK